MVSTMTSLEPIKIPEGYKQTEVGVIPTDWEVTKIGRICNVTVGKDVDLSYSKESDFKYCYPVFSNTVDVPGIYGYYDYPEYSGDVVTVVGRGVGLGTAICRSGGFGAIGRLIVLFPQKGVSQNFLASYINHKIDVFSESSGVPQLTGIAFANYDIALPPSEEQTAIANALSDVDNLIASLETLIAKKSAIKTAAMQQLLTGKKRLPAFVKESEKQSGELDNTSETAQAAQTKQTSTLNSDLYKESSEGLDSKSNQYSEVGNANNKQTAPRPGYKQTELGEIPEDWEVGSLPEFVWYQEGPGLRNWQFTSKGIKVINVTNLQYSGYLALDKTSRHVSIEEFEKMYRHFECDAGDFVMASSGNSYSKSSIVRECDLPLLMNTSVIRFKAKDNIEALYMQSYLKSDFFKEQIDLMITGGAQPNFGPYHLDRIFLPIPSSLGEQAAIAEALSDMSTELDVLKQRLTKTQKIKQGMMQELLTGKTRLV